MGRFRLNLAILVLALSSCVFAQTTRPPTTRTSAPAIARTYFIQAERVLWNYTDLSTNNHCMARPYNEEEKIFVEHTETTIGSSYFRGLYREYTDATFTRRQTRAEWEHLGSLGPAIRGTVGETIRIVFRNALPFACNLRANSAIVTNEAPGSNLPVAPGATTTYTWTFTAASAPGTLDASSTMYIYRSYVDSSVHDYTGLVGPVIVTRKGMATSSTNLRPKDVSREFVLMFGVINENENYFLQDNIDTFLNGATPEDADAFEESNLMHAINGRLYCYRDSLFTMNAGETIRWYVMDIGSEVDLHTPHWHANVVEVQGHQVDEFKMEPGAVTVATMKPDSVGTWLLHCHVNDHIKAGMITTFTVRGARPLLSAAPGRTVTYYIAAEEVMWDYLPGGKRMCTSPMVPPPEPEDILGLPNVYKKAQYICYTDSTFRVRCPKEASMAHTGILGPVLRANVGDTLRVVFLNRLNVPTSLHPHGVFYNVTSEGANYRTKTGLANGAVQPGQRWTYQWFVREEAGPGPKDGSNIMWMYHSHTDEVADTNAGLVGMIIISRYGAVKDYDREFFLSVSSMDETSSFFYEDYLQRNNLQETDEEEVLEFHMKLSINGYLHCTLPGLVANTGERVRWHILSLGTEIDVHSAVWTGQTVTQYSMRQGSLILQPANMHTVDMVAAGCGNFSFYCSVADHMEHGMMSNFVVRGGARGCPRQTRSFNREAFIQAEEYEWDYAARGQGCNGAFTEHELEYLGNGDDRIGRKYIKARYRAYTDATFTTPVNTPGYLGMVGPNFRVAVGDSVRVVFRNKLSFPANIVPLGLQYDSDALVQPGKQGVYFWLATNASGPASGDGSTIAWIYRSTYNQVGAELSGLFGAVIVSRAGLGGFARDVQREYVLSFSINDENGSPFLERNIKKYTQTKTSAAVAALIADPDFQESNLKHAVNGNLFCNLRVDGKVGERVRLYLLSVGSSLDMHSITIRDNTLLTGSRTDLYSRSFAAPSYAGTIHVVDVVLERAGTFLVQCDVHDHHNAGMEARFRVTA